MLASSTCARPLAAQTKSMHYGKRGREGMCPPSRVRLTHPTKPDEDTKRIVSTCIVRSTEICNGGWWHAHRFAKDANGVAHCQSFPQQRAADKQVNQQACSQIGLTMNIVSPLDLCVPSLRRSHADVICWNWVPCRARGVVVSHPLSMREALGSIPSVSSCHRGSKFDG